MSRQVPDRYDGHMICSPTLTPTLNLLTQHYPGDPGTRE
jgi:hypothetical protein